MTKYAEIDLDNKVINIVIGTESSISRLSGNFIKCTEATRDAVIGSTYDDEDGVFIPQQPYPSWTLGEDNVWHPPVARPEPGVPHMWDEATGSWIELESIEIDL